jgi:hypothetical protein
LVEDLSKLGVVLALYTSPLGRALLFSSVLLSSATTKRPLSSFDDIDTLDRLSTSSFGVPSTSVALLFFPSQSMGVKSSPKVLQLSLFGTATIDFTIGRIGYLLALRLFLSLHFLILPHFREQIATLALRLYIPQSTFHQKHQRDEAGRQYYYW